MKNTEDYEPVQYSYLTQDMLDEGVVWTTDDNDQLIEEVFEYNHNAVMSRIKVLHSKEAKKGYLIANPIVFLGTLLMLKVLEINWKESLLAWIVIVLFWIVYIYGIMVKDFDVRRNIIAAAILLLADKRFVFLLVMNIALCYIYQDAYRSVKNELGYPNFPSVDLVIKYPNGEHKRLFAREME